MNYLDAVAFAQRDLRPIGAPHHFAVEFDGETFGRKIELSDESFETYRLRHLARFAVDFNMQFVSLDG